MSCRRVFAVATSFIAIVAIAMVLVGPRTVDADAAKSISSGDGFTCAVTSGGGVKCWGSDSIGELGTGNATAPDICTSPGSDSYPCSKSPVDVAGLTSGVKAVSAGTSHACVIMETGGTVKCWGKNQFGQLGNGGTGPDTCHSVFDYGCSLSPVDVVGLTDVVQVEAGSDHTCARTSAGAVKCWGLSGFGELGTAGSDMCAGFECAKTPVNSPITSGAKDLATGADHTCVITGQDAAKCFGIDGSGELGNGTLGPDSCQVGRTSPCSKSPVQVQGLTSGVKDITAGDSHTCAIVNGGTKCWGNNHAGQLGRDEGSKNCSVSECFSKVPVDIAATGEMIEAGQKYTCVGPNIACWGFNNFGQLNGTSGPDTCKNGLKCSLAPVSEAGLAGQIVALAPDDSHTCVLERGGKVECWGYGFLGQMGNGANEFHNATPVAPTGFDGVVTTPTAAAHPIGDSNCDNTVDATDGALALGAAAGVGSPACIGLANVKCDDALTPLDALLIFKYAATLAVQLPASCRAIGS